MKGYKAVAPVRSLILLFAMLAAALCLDAPAVAQSIFASIVGTVTDPSGTSVPDAKVTAVNTSTGEKREFQADSLGNFEISNLFPGTYVIEVEAAGFAKERREGIKLTSNDNVRIDVAISVAKQVTGITVTAEPATRVETESSKLSDVRTLPQLRSLPMADRSVYRYLSLTAGVTGGITLGTRVTPASVRGCYRITGR